MVTQDEHPIKIWQLTLPDGKTKTVSVWSDRKIRTGYWYQDFWTTLWRSQVGSLTDEQWAASPGEDWRDITPTW